MKYSRHRSRQYALQALYQQEITDSTSFTNTEEFFEQLVAPENSKEFALTLIQGTIENQLLIDRILNSHLERWRLNRLSVLVRCLLRLAVFELYFDRSTPGPVVMDEAVELSRDFIHETARGFINSVLQKVYQEVESLKGDVAAKLEEFRNREDLDLVDDAEDEPDAPFSPWPQVRPPAPQGRTPRPPAPQERAPRRKRIYTQSAKSKKSQWDD